MSHAKLPENHAALGLADPVGRLHEALKVAQRRGRWSAERTICNGFPGPIGVTRCIGLDLRGIVAGGRTGFENLLQNEDLLGVGYVHAEPSDPALDDESILEVFYRVRVTDTLEVTPAVQAVFDPVANPNQDTVVIGAIRAQFTF